MSGIRAIAQASRSGSTAARVLIAAMLVAIFLPLATLVMWSVAGVWRFPDLLPERLIGRAWVSLAQPGSRVLRATAGSLSIAAAVSVLNLAIAVPAAWGFARYRSRTRALVSAEVLVFAPMLIPPLAVALGLHVGLLRIGLSDRWSGVVIAHLLPTVPYMTVVLTSVFRSLPDNLDSQARSLGASPLQAFVRVVIPAARGGLITGALFVFLVSWSQYLLTILIGGGRVLTLPVVLYAFASSGDFAMTAASGIVFLVPVLLVLAISSRLLGGRSLPLAGPGRF